jgi:DNA polymerase-3 subunit gamma/tau
MFVAKREGINAEEEALLIIGQKADGALRDALSIFDQIVSLSGKNVTYAHVIENLNVLDFEYYFKIIDAAVSGDVSSVLITLNEILEKGFDGHNFVSGLNSHLRDLLVSKDESTLKLLEATQSIRQRYLQQTSRCPADFIFKALETGTNCDLTYKTSKNPRLHIELFLIRLCRLITDSFDSTEKKKPDQQPVEKEEVDFVPPSKSEILREKVQDSDNNVIISEIKPSKHEPVIEKPSKAFSIKDIISENIEKVEEVKTDMPVQEHNSLQREEFNPVAFESAWKEFTDQLSGEGTRIVSMFKAIKPEVINDQTIRIHLNNMTQKETFVLNYKQRLITFLENRFILSDTDIESIVDLSDNNEILYTDDQKFNYLFNKYPILKEMKNTFKLDIN